MDIVKFFAVGKPLSSEFFQANSITVQAQPDSPVRHQ